MTSQTTTDEQQIRNLEQQFHEAFLNRDTETLDQLLADDFLFIDPAGAHATKADWMNDMTSRATTYESIHEDDLQVRVYGDAAVSIGLVTMKGKSTQTGDFHGQFCYTCMYVKMDGRWRAVVEQANLMPQQ